MRLRDSEADELLRLVVTELRREPARPPALLELARVLRGLLERRGYTRQTIDTLDAALRGDEAS